MALNNLQSLICHKTRPTNLLKSSRVRCIRKQPRLLMGFNWLSPKLIYKVVLRWVTIHKWWFKFGYWKKKKKYLVPFSIPHIGAPSHELSPAKSVLPVDTASWDQAIQMWMPGRTILLMHLKSCNVCYIVVYYAYTYANTGKYKKQLADSVVQVRIHLITSDFSSSTRGERQFLSLS